MTKESDILTALMCLQNRVDQLIAFFRQELDFSEMIYEYWSARDILGHLTFWHESFSRNLSDLSNGKTPNPLKGKLSEVNRMSVETTRGIAIDVLIDRLCIAQNTINKHILNTSISSIPYKKGSRDYSRHEHLTVVADHFKRHLKDLHKKYKLNYAETKNKS
ncbi:hypothetical protein QQ020_29920 [Fulvivirgaceae bacterium BMA12]|uniref:DinB-like domain-containing protein n=1 Tax=Agaribacillus aureus TaxID=3051825 RepID=A0ABT8LFH4_9BACT|nr:hypothetical protein [Fulvivirgaceae bacterium BMA12]